MVLILVRLMMKFKLLILLSVVIASCNRQVSTNYYFSDGIRIDTSIHFSSVENELKNIIDSFNLNSNSLNVYTSLNNQIHSKIAKPWSVHYDTLVARLYIDYADSKAYLDSISKIKQFFETGIFIIENKTGRVLVYYNSSSNSDQIQEKYPLGSMYKSFQYALAMDKEFKPSDIYPRTRDVIHGSTIVKVPDTSSKFNFYETFSYSFGHSMTELYVRYPIHDFVKLLDTLNCEINSKDTNVIFYPTWHLSMFDITKSHTVFKNKGNLIEPTFIDSITDENNNLVYKSEIKPKKVLSNNTADEMLSLLEYSINRGFGARIRFKYKYTEPLAGRFGDSQNLNTTSYICITDEYTIGIRNSFAVPDRKHKSLRNWSAHKILLPIWHEVMQLMKNEYE